MTGHGLQSAQEKSSGKTGATLMKKARKFFRRFFIGMGIIFTVTTVFSLIAAARLSPSIPDNILLTYTFRPALGEDSARPSLSGPLLRAPVSLEDVVQALDRAVRDARVKGFAAKIEGLSLSPAQVQELRGAVLRLRAAGKFAEIYAGSFGGMGAGMGDYYLASAFDTIWLQPVGMVAINGISAEMPFARDLLDKIGAEAFFGHKGKYKSAPESLTASAASPESREMMASLIGDLSAQMLSDIAKDRKLAPEEMAGYRDRSPYVDKAALDLKLVDHLGYDDEMTKGARDKAGLGEKDSAVDLDDYIASREDAGLAASFSETRKIALVTGSGEIVPAEGAGGGIGGGAMAATDIAEAFDSILKDKDVAAVVFRIDSPGGSPEAAETIRRAVMRVQDSGRPVVVSMGGYAASGGYWIAAPADKIIAQPGTLAGSIGVFGGKIVLEKLWSKIGLNWETVKSGRNADMWSANRAFTPEQFAAFDALLGHTYDAFLSRVMEGRKMTREKAESVAEGRVFTGRQALDNGLVDALGGLDEAVVMARDLAKIDAGADVPLVSYPPKKTRLENLTAMLVGEQQVSLLPLLQIRAADIADALREALSSPAIIR